MSISTQGLELFHIGPSQNFAPYLVWDRFHADTQMAQGIKITWAEVCLLVHRPVKPSLLMVRVTQWAGISHHKGGAVLCSAASQALSHPDVPVPWHNWLVSIPSLALHSLTLLGDPEHGCYGQRQDIMFQDICDEHFHLERLLLCNF